ncbi:unnamed protein product [Moneuplotes crassus]|uniref:Uncharacterized protein n=1 Tax=Euplotes crassus TaxID=5936 RepID=A0AAD1XY05_EUPCR|nr:unnamed protein product [Moneuplotes crassus]
MISSRIVILLVVLVVTINAMRIRQDYGDRAEAGTPSTITAHNNANQDSTSNSNTNEPGFTDDQWGTTPQQVDNGVNGDEGDSPLYGNNFDTQLITTDGSSVANAAYNEVGMELMGEQGDLESRADPAPSS